MVESPEPEAGVEGTPRYYQAHDTTTRASIKARMNVVRVLVADDQPVIRAGLRTLLGAADDMVVVGEACDGAEVVSMARELVPDVVLLDLRMPGVDGIDATIQLARSTPSARVLVLTNYDTDEAVLAAFEAGAAGLLLKTSSPRELLSSVRSVAAGASVLSHSVMKRLMTRPAPRARLPRVAELAGKVASFGEGEVKVLALVGAGMSNKEISEALHLSLTSVKTYVSRILRRLGLENRTQAAILAYELGLSGGVDGGGAGGAADGAGGVSGGGVTKGAGSCLPLV
ncbi:response regulator [Streptomyces sp. NPDC059002]|uniref:response regulator transcription factor n=1 Tax=Streptomyces sp. NPDC059002 TaxID=3346690 RepID=UPI0036CF64C1